RGKWPVSVEARHSGARAVLAEVGDEPPEEHFFGDVVVNALQSVPSRLSCGWSFGERFSEGELHIELDIRARTVGVEGSETYPSDFRARIERFAVDTCADVPSPLQFEDFNRLVRREVVDY